MSSYWRDADKNKTFKVDTENDDGVAYVYYVQIWRDPNTLAFVHARGRDVIQKADKAEEIMKLTSLPVTENVYIQALKDYFAIDKKVREQFIEKYKL